MVRKALALLVAVAVVGAALGVVGLLRPNTVDAQTPSATRSFSTMSVAPEGELSVTITARDYGSPGRVEENIARWVQLCRRLYNSWAGRY